MRKPSLFFVPAILAALLHAASGAQLLETGSFESPRVKERTPKNKGGSPLRANNSDWMQFDDKVDEENGRLKGGITNEMARTGKQSLYIEYDKLATDKAAVILTSNLLGIRPSQTYRVAIWGRLPKKNPLTIDQRLAYMKLFVEFFQVDRETPCEEGEQLAMRAQPIPGSKNRPALFRIDRWSEFFTRVKSPADAAFMRLRWQWETPSQEGATSGIIFFDDATVIGEAGEKPPEPELLDPEKMDDEGNFPSSTPPAPAPGAPAANAVNPAAPAATPAAKKP